MGCSPEVISGLRSLASAGMTSYLEQVDQLQHRRARWPWLAGAAVVLVLATAGVTWWLTAKGVHGGGHPPAAELVAASSPAVASPTASAMQYGSSMAACQGIDALVKAGKLDNMDQLQAYGNAAVDSSDRDVMARARLLRQMAMVAIASKDPGDAETTREYAVEMQQACIRAGYA